MDFSDPLYDALALVCRADAVDVRDHEIAPRIPTPDFPDGYVWASVGYEELDALVERGLIELIGEDEFGPSHDGRWHYQRWEKAQERAAQRPTTNPRRALSWRKARRR